MDTFLVLLSLSLGGLLGVVCTLIHWSRMLEKQRKIEARYQAMIWQQLEQCRELIQHNHSLLTDNSDLRHKHTALQHTHEKQLAALN